MTTAIIATVAITILLTAVAAYARDPLGDHYADVVDALGEEVAR